MLFSLPSRPSLLSPESPVSPISPHLSTVSSSTPSTWTALVSWQGKSHACSPESEILASHTMLTKYRTAEYPWIFPTLREPLAPLQTSVFRNVQKVLKLATLCQTHLEITIRLSTTLGINSRQQAARGNQNRSVSKPAT